MKLLRKSDKSRFLTSAGKNRILIPLTAMLLAFVMLLEPTTAAQAAETGSTATDSTETSSYYREDDGTIGTVTLQYPVSGAEFSIYKVGTANEEGGYTLVEPFSDYSVLTASSAAATALADYVQRDTGIVDGVDPLDTVTSDKDGNAEFTGLHRGVYLILGGTIEADGYIYTASPVLFELPNLQKTESGSNNYEEIWDLTIEGKYDKKEKPVTPEDETTELKVLKVWKSDDEDSRPESITVQLLCNGKLSDRSDAEVTLTKAGGWTYEWTDLEASQEWTVVEKTVPEGYKVNRSKDGTSFVITNTKTTPSTPSTPGTTTKKTGKLPQTGQLWWPVTVLIAVGLFLILIGLLLRPNGDGGTILRK